MKHKAALDEGFVDPRSGLGVTFRKELDRDEDGAEEILKSYKAMNRKEAATYRLEWLKGKYDKAKETRTEKMSWQRVDKTQGEYKSLGQMIVMAAGLIRMLCKGN